MRNTRFFLKQVNGLLVVCQKRGESLEDYLKQFDDARVEVDDCDDAIAITAFTVDLRPEPFHYSPGKKKAWTYKEILDRAEKYINADKQAYVKEEDDPSKSLKKDKKRKREDEEFLIHNGKTIHSTTPTFSC